MIELAGCIIKDEQGRILLMHRNDGRYDHWEIPGGKIEPDESPEAAAVREIKEELDIKVEIQEKLGEKKFIDRGQKLHYTWFSAKITDGESKVAEPQKFDDLHYFSPTEMKKMFDNLSLGAQNYLDVITL